MLAHVRGIQVERQWLHPPINVLCYHDIDLEGKHKYLKEIPEEQEIIAYVDKYMQRNRKKGVKAPWRRMSKQIKSLYDADIPPWKVSRIASRKLKDRASL